MVTRRHLATAVSPLRLNTPAQRPGRAPRAPDRWSGKSALDSAASRSCASLRTKGCWPRTDNSATRERPSFRCAAARARRSGSPEASAVPTPMSLKRSQAFLNSLLENSPGSTRRPWVRADGGMTQAHRACWYRDGDTRHRQKDWRFLRHPKSTNSGPKWSVRSLWHEF